MSDLCETRMRREYDAAPAIEKAYYAGERAKRNWEEIEIEMAAFQRAEADHDRWLAEAVATTPPVTSWEIERGTLTLEIATVDGEPRGTVWFRPRPDTPYHIRLKEAGQR